MRQVPYHFSVVVPVLNESEQINTLIEHIRNRAGSYGCQIVVIDGDPAGSTVRVIRDNGVLTAISKPGRGRQMNAGTAAATGDVLLFLHADTRLPAQAFVRIHRLMENDDYVGGAFDLGLDSDRWAFRYVELAAALRSRLLRIPYGDQAIFMRRDYFEKIGRYKELPLMEDVDLMRRVKKAGGKIRILNDRVITSARKWEKDGVLFGTLRNHVLVALFCVGVSPQRLVRFYYGRRF